MTGGAGNIGPGALTLNSVMIIRAKTRVTLLSAGAPRTSLALSCHYNNDPAAPLCHSRHHYQSSILGH